MWAGWCDDCGPERRCLRSATPMGSWYPVVKTIKGLRYLYAQQTYRVGGGVKTHSRYIGSVGGGESAQLSGALSRFRTANVAQDAAEKWDQDRLRLLVGGAPMHL